jgi:hypothetical protein
MKTNSDHLSLLHKIISRLSFIGYLIITLVQSVTIESKIEKNKFNNNLDKIEVVILFYIFMVNITICIKLKRIVSSNFN